MNRAHLVVLLGLSTAAAAPAQNLVPDPTFSSGLSTWMIRGAPSTTSLDWHQTAGADGAPGFARLSGVGGPGAFFARVCLPVQAGTVYSWGGLLRVDPTPDMTAQFTVLFYADASCQGPLGLLMETGPSLDGATASPGIWYLRTGPDVAAPPSAASVALEVVLLSVLEPTRSVDFDNVFFGPRGTGPPAGISVPTLSAPAFLALVAALAIAGAWRLLTRC